MDPSRFDMLVREIGGAVTRRGALALLIGALAAPIVALPADASRGGSKRRHRRDGRARNRDRRQRQNRGTRAEAVCYPGSPCVVGPSANLAKCDLSASSALQNAACPSCNLGGANLTGADAANANLKSANLGKACLVDADLSGANLANANLTGAILCRTRMPNGTLNNTGCGKPTACCETCNVLPVGSCAAAGSICCGGATCQSGSCVCPNGQTDCDGVCRNLQTDRNNCGSCGQRCGQGETCQAGQCGVRCGDGFCAAGSAVPDCCGASCTNVETDRANCGSCGNACGTSETCKGGVCGCAGCLTSGICVAGTAWNLCGADGASCIRCAAGEVCDNGEACASCATQGGTSWCDRDETTRCNGGVCSCLTRVGNQGGFCASSISCSGSGGPPVCVTDADCAGFDPPGQRRCIVVGDCQGCAGGVACATPCAS